MIKNANDTIFFLFASQRDENDRKFKKEPNLDNLDVCTSVVVTLIVFNKFKYEKIDLEKN